MNCDYSIWRDGECNPVSDRYSEPS